MSSERLTYPHFPNSHSGRNAAVQTVVRYMEVAGLAPGDRLPPERKLASELGMTRDELRKALDALVRDGTIWRHVGKGTFVCDVGGRSKVADALKLESSFDVLSRTNPMELLEARLLLEPTLAAMAALRGAALHFAEINKWLHAGQMASDYQSSQKAGDAWHRSIAVAAQNQLLLWVFDHLFRVLDSIDWGRLTPAAHPEGASEVWADHRRITEAVCVRDASAAERLMRLHLEGLRRRIACAI